MIFVNACFCGKCHSYNTRVEINIKTCPEEKVVRHCYKCGNVCKVNCYKNKSDSYDPFDETINYESFSDSLELFSCHIYLTENKKTLVD